MIIGVGVLAPIFLGLYFVVFIYLVDKKAPLDVVATAPQSSFTAPAQAPPNLLKADDKNCGDFFDQDDAQKYFVAQGGPAEDPDNLDLDDDGSACENYVFSNDPPTTEANDK